MPESDGPKRDVEETTATGDAGDTELGEAFVAGDDAAFEVLYRRYARPIHDYALGITRDRGLAEDITQTVFARAYEQRGSLREPGAVRAWLYRIAHNAAVNQMSRTVRTGEITDDAPIASADRGPEQLVEEDEATRLVWDAAASLDERQFTVLDLSLRKGLSSAEIGEVLGLDGPQASLALHRAREALGNAVRYLVVARRRRHCERLAELVPASIRTLTAEQRATVDRHMRRCSDCQEVARVLTDPAQLFAAVPLVALPGTLLEWHGHASPRARTSSRAPRPRALRLLLQPGGIAAASAVAVVGVAAVIAVAVHHPQHHPAPRPAAATTTIATPSITTVPSAARAQLATLAAKISGAQHVGPVVDGNRTFGAVAYADTRGVFVRIYTYRPGGWQPVSTIDALTNGAGLNVEQLRRVHLTTGLDFLVPIQLADSQGAVVVSNASGTWKAVPFDDPNQAPNNLVVNPIVGDHTIETISRSCGTNCVSGRIIHTTWRYDAAKSAFRGTIP